MRACALIGAVLGSMVLCTLWRETQCHSVDVQKSEENDANQLKDLQVRNTGVRGNTGSKDVQVPPTASITSSEDDTIFTGEGRRQENDTSLHGIIDVSVELPVVSFPFPLPPGVVAMFMDSLQELAVNFTLRCTSPGEEYVLEVSLRQQERHFVARLTEPVAINISCSDAFSDPPDFHGSGNVSGTFNVSITSGLLGKGVLLFFLRSSEDNGTSSGRAVRRSPADEFQPTLASSAVVVNTISPVANPEPNLSPSAATSAEDLTSNLVHQTFVLVLRPQRLIDIVFRIVTYVVVALATVCMGCKTDLKVIRDVLKKPAAPALGFVSQYVGMPLIAYGLARTIKLDNPAVSFGIFTCGVCPGGGMSNMYSYLLGGDVSLSVTMTTISTTVALGMIPLWLFTLGETIDKGAMGQLTVPYVTILQILATIILPLFVGIFIQYRLPRVKKVILKVVTPFSVLTILFFVTVGLYANLYIFQLFEPLILLAGCLLPYIGYVLGGVLALIFRQPWTRVKTIAIETGIQNVGVAFLILLFSLSPPDGELAAVGPAASALMTPVPLFVLTVAYLVYNKCRGRPLTGDRDQKVKDEMLRGRPSIEMEVVSGKMIDDTD